MTNLGEKDQAIDRNYVLYDGFVQALPRLLGSRRAELLARASRSDPLRSWFYFALKASVGLDSVNKDVRKVNYYEFGTGWGSTLVKFLDALRSINYSVRLPPEKVSLVLFDSFEGLPESTDNRDLNPEWRVGQFSHSVSQIKSLLQWKRYPTDIPSTYFVKGHYDASLTVDLRMSLTHIPPTIITIDVDYYSSASTVLRWLRPLLNPGAYLYLDGAWDFHGDPSKGELGALNEFNEEGRGRFLQSNEFRIPELIGKTFVYLE